MGQFLRISYLLLLKPHSYLYLCITYSLQVTEFCDKNMQATPANLWHNSNAINAQNKYCDGKSAWEIMRKHDDFKDGKSCKPTKVDISCFKSVRATRCLLSRSQQGHRPVFSFDRLIEFSRRFLKELFV